MSDDATPRLGLPYVAAGQAQKHVTVNEAFARLDGLVQTAVASRTIAAQPAEPEDGVLYILPEDATGDAWGGEAAGSLMRFEAGGWERAAPGAGHIAWISDEGRLLVRDDAGDWRGLLDLSNPESLVVATSEHGAKTRFSVLEEDVVLSGPFVATTIVIPSRAIAFSVGTRTLTTITGATSYDCGIAGAPSKFGGSLGVSAGSTNQGVIGPQAFYADTPVLVSASGPDFTGGTVRVAIHIVQFDLPAA
ncbi:MAG: DUF2793 domain-containing protein [Pseudomonadota bacterium]